MAASDIRGRQRNSPGRGAKGAAKGGKGRGGKKRGGGAVLPSVANHPRAGDQVKRAKGWAGLAGFALVAFVSWRGEVPVEYMLLRALAGGIVAYLVVWATAVGLPSVCFCRSRANSTSPTGRR